MQRINAPQKQDLPEGVDAETVSVTVRGAGGKMLVKEGKSELLMALGKLSEREQRIIELKFWGEMSNKEIAETLDVSAANVGVILFRAMGSLRKILGEE